MGILFLYISGNMKQNLSLFAKEIMASYQTIAKRGLVSSSSIRSIFIPSLKLSVVHLGLKTLISGPLPCILSNRLTGRYECHYCRAKQQTIAPQSANRPQIQSFSGAPSKKKVFGIISIHLLEDH